MEDLLTHRPGFATALIAQGELGQAVQALTGGLARRSKLDPHAWIALLASLPLARAPGEEVINGFATDVLGVLIARECGKTLGEVLQERVFEPLGMADTAFWVPAESLGRLTPAYVVQWLSGKKRMVDDPRTTELAHPPAFESGAGGLVSTLSDYSRFGQMLLGDGKLNGTRVLSRKTVELMTTNMLSPEQRAIPFFGTMHWAARGLGLGVYVLDNLAKHRALGTVGQYGWGGTFSTTWFNDPVEALSVTMMCNASFPTVNPPVRSDFETMIYQAIDD
jgi:CubicO group peptidase (beta-lactamase class C family)